MLDSSDRNTQQDSLTCVAPMVDTLKLWIQYTASRNYVTWSHNDNGTPKKDLVRFCQSIRSLESRRPVGIILLHIERPWRLEVPDNDSEMFSLPSFICVPVSRRRLTTPSLKHPSLPIRENGQWELRFELRSQESLLNGGDHVRILTFRKKKCDSIAHTRKHAPLKSPTEVVWDSPKSGELFDAQVVRKFPKYNLKRRSHLITNCSFTATNFPRWLRMLRTSLWQPNLQLLWILWLERDV